MTTNKENKMISVWFIKHPWGSVEGAFKTRDEAEKHSGDNPLHVHHAGGRETTEFYMVEQGTLPCIVYCKTCKTAGRKTIVTATDPKKYPYCKNCFYTGAASEHQMADTILKIAKGIPDSQVSVSHTGGGCFMLDVSVGDGVYYGITGDDFECLTIPTEGVGTICRYKEQEPDEQNEYGGTWMALVYEGYDVTAETEITKIPVAKAISLIKRDIKKPAKAELV